MKTMKYLSMLLMIVAMSVCMVGCGDDDDKDQVTDFAGQIAGVYTGRLTENNTVIEDAYVVSVTKISSTVVSVAADFYNDGIRNYNVAYSNGQFMLTSETSSNITISIMGKSMSISFLNAKGTITTFSGKRD